MSNTPQSDPSTQAKPQKSWSMSTLMALMFSMDHPVTRRQYLITGVTLMAFKYCIEALLVYAVLGKFWHIGLFLLPVMSLKLEALAGAEWLFIILVLWSLPFLWIGFTMSVRRLIHAGRSPWSSLTFMMPFINLIFMISLCFLMRLRRQLRK